MRTLIRQARRVAAGVGFFLPFLAAQLGAQQPVKKTAAIVGIAVDSLHGSPLRGADVMVDGVNRTIVTDSLGRFRVDSIPPGRYQVGIFHPVLDSLGISLATQPFSVGPDSTSVVVLAVPSAETLIAQTCRARPRTLGRSAIFGRLLDPDSGEPISGADVSVVWTDYEVSKVLGVHRTPRLIRDSTDSNGAFRLCGLPSELDATLQANYRGAMTADVPVSTSSVDGEFIIRPLYVSRADTAGTKAGKAVVTGRVTYPGGAPAPGSRVEIFGSAAVAVTDERGEFTIGGAPSGTQLLLVRKLGYSAQSLPLDLSVRQPQKVTVRLQKSIPIMDPVLVTARSDRALEGVGFTQRKKSGLGHYITADEISRRNAFYLSDLLRTVPGLRQETTGGRPSIVSTRGGSRGGCVTYVVDGFRWPSLTGGDANDFVSPSEIAGIEVYQASFAPAEYQSIGQSCTTIIIWTKFKVRSF